VAASRVDIKQSGIVSPPEIVIAVGFSAARVLAPIVFTWFKANFLTPV
jgi:hypothetical protein